MFVFIISNILVNLLAKLQNYSYPIELTHTARSREGFALGAVRACEWLFNGLKQGSLSKGNVYTMTDLLV